MFFPEGSYSVREPPQKCLNCGTDYNGKQVIHFTAALNENKFTPAAINTLGKSRAVHMLCACSAELVLKIWLLKKM